METLEVILQTSVRTYKFTETIKPPIFMVSGNWFTIALNPESFRVITSACEKFMYVLYL